MSYAHPERRRPRKYAGREMLGRATNHLIAFMQEVESATEEELSALIDEAECDDDRDFFFDALGYVRWPEERRGS